MFISQHKLWVLDMINALQQFNIFSAIFTSLRADRFIASSVVMQKKYYL